MTAGACTWQGALGEPCRLPAGHRGIHDCSPDAPVTDLICDFCGPSAARWEYPARAFTTAVALVGDDVTEYRSDGAWTACDECRPYVDGRRWDDLAAAVIGRLHVSSDVGTVTAGLVRLWRLFDANRTGPPYPV